MPGRRRRLEPDGAAALGLLWQGRSRRPLTLRPPGSMIGRLEGRMGSLGLPEIIFIFLVALLIFGPKKLPELGRTLGRGVAEFRRATDELKRSINTELALDETPAPPVLRTRRLEDPEVRPHEVVHHEAVIVA